MILDVSSSVNAYIEWYSKMAEWRLKRWDWIHFASYHNQALNLYSMTTGNDDDDSEPAILFMCARKAKYITKFPYRQHQQNSYQFFISLSLYLQHHRSSRFTYKRYRIWLSCFAFLWHLAATREPSHLHTLSFEWCLQMAAASVHFISSFLKR